jgi:hypothetical protein
MVQADREGGSAIEAACRAFRRLMIMFIFIVARIAASALGEYLPPQRFHTRLRFRWEDDRL